MHCVMLYGCTNVLRIWVCISLRSVLVKAPMNEITCRVWVTAAPPFSESGGRYTLEMVWGSLNGELITRSKGFSHYQLKVGPCYNIYAVVILGCRWLILSKIVCITAEKWLKPWRIGTYLKVLSKSCWIETNMMIFSAILRLSRD